MGPFHSLGMPRRRPASIAPRPVEGGGTGLPGAASFALRAYPNPTTGQLFYDLPRWQPHQARVFDMTGRLVLAQSVQAEGLPLGMRRIPKTTASPGLRRTSPSAKYPSRTP